MIKARTLLIVLLLLAMASLFLSLTLGSVHIGWAELWQVFSGHDSGLNHDLVIQLRLPRALCGFASGALLALAGTLMQVLLRNPLADPYVLGISGGAAVAALGSMLLGVGGMWLTGSAFIGAMLSMLLVFGLARGDGSWTQTRLLLTGVIVASGWGAMISFILVIAPEAKLRGMLFWMMGDLSGADAPMLSMAVMVTGLLVALPMARSLNIMGHGELTAKALGVPVKQLRLGIYLLASLLTATAVMAAGSIGFVGLVVPHILRLLVGSDQRVLLPGSVLLGGSLLVFADTLARTIIAPEQLPVGVITAMLGVPLFLYLLSRHRR